MERRVLRRVEPGVGLRDVVEFKNGEAIGRPSPRYGLDPRTARDKFAAVTLNRARYTLHKLSIEIRIRYLNGGYYVC